MHYAIEGHPSYGIQLHIFKIYHKCGNSIFTRPYCKCYLSIKNHYEHFQLRRSCYHWGFQHTQHGWRQYHYFWQRLWYAERFQDMQFSFADLVLGSSSNSWTIGIGSSSCEPVAFFSSSSMQCLSKALSAGAGFSLPMRISIANLTEVSSSFSYSAPELVSLNATSTQGLPTQGGGWIRVHGSNLFPVDISNTPIRIGSRFDISCCLFHAISIKSHCSTVHAQL